MLEQPERYDMSSNDIKPHWIYDLITGLPFVTENKLNLNKWFYYHENNGNNPSHSDETSLTMKTLQILLML
jgi:hypothetical protein